MAMALCDAGPQPEVKPAPVRRIKIKFGATVLATTTLKLQPGLVGATSQDSKQCRQDRVTQVAQARSRQAALQSYIPPTASPDAIVARLRDGEVFSPGEELPPWDFTAPSPAERPAKRPKLARDSKKVVDCSSPTAVVVSARVPSPAEQAKPGSRGEGPGRPVAARFAPTSAPPPSAKAKARAAAERIAAAGAALDSLSDQTHSHQAGAAGLGALVSPSAEETGDAAPPHPSIPHPRTSTAAQQTAAHSSFLSSHHASTHRTSRSVLQPAASAHSEPASAATVPSATAPRTRTPPRPSTAAPSQPRPHPHPPPPTRQPSSTRPGSPPPPPSSSSSPAGRTAETQTRQHEFPTRPSRQDRDFPVLPTTFLEVPQLSGTALSFNSIGPYDLQLESRPKSLLAEAGTVEALMNAAQGVKREGDRMFKQQNNCWTVGALSRYIEGSLMFMEAAEGMLRERMSRSAERAALIYCQTAQLLEHSSRFAGSIKGNGVGREALRLLAERLAATCLLRNTALHTQRYADCAGRALSALKEQHRQQAQAQAAGAAGSSAAAQAQQSPEDSSTSSLNPAAAPHASAGSSRLGSTSHSQHHHHNSHPHPHPHHPGGASAGAAADKQSQVLPGFGQDQMADLVSFAKVASQFSEYMRRSAKGFEAFLERADVRQNQQAKLVCMHLAAVCMDVGMTPGMRIIQHAREALRTLREDLAR